MGVGNVIGYKYEDMFDVNYWEFDVIRVDIVLGWFFLEGLVVIVWGLVGYKFLI